MIKILRRVLFKLFFKFTLFVSKNVAAYLRNAKLYFSRP